MDKSWINKVRWSPEYRNGVKDFLEFSFKNSFDGDVILCPCKECANCYLKTREVVYEHLIHKGFLSGYTQWLCHGESSSFSVDKSNPHQPSLPDDEVDDLRVDDMNRLIQEAFGLSNGPVDEFEPFSSDDESDEENLDEQPSMADHGEQSTTTSAAAAGFAKLVQDADDDLYPGCKKFSRLSFIVRLFHLKCLSRWTNKSFTQLLELLNEAFPEINDPVSTPKTKQFLRRFGLSYDKIDACANDCILYWRERKNEHAACWSKAWGTACFRHLERGRQGMGWSKAWEHGDTY